jgi:hypothetical protein
MSESAPLTMIPLGTLTFHSGPQHQLGSVPAGKRTIWEIEDIVWEGDRLRGRKKGSVAADWLLAGSDQTLLLDIRFLLETHDGALVYVFGPGRVDTSRGVPGPGYFAPMFEAGDPRYSWLNRIQAVARSRAEPGKFIYQVYELR